MAGPWSTRQEMLTDMALESAISDPETIRQTRPVVPQVLFPEREGFAKQEHNIYSVMNMSRNGVTYRSWVSGMPVMRSSFEDGSFSGSGRYSMNSLWSS
jgi:hypothetical protein